MRIALVLFCAALAFPAGAYAQVRAPLAEEAAAPFGAAESRPNGENRTLLALAQPQPRHTVETLPRGGKALEWFEKLQIGGSVTAVVQSGSGAEAGPAPAGNRTVSSLSVDLEFLSALSETSGAYAHFAGGKGPGIDATVPTLTGLNGDALDSPAAELTEAWYERRFFGGVLKARGGKLDLTTEFDDNKLAKDQKAQFLAGGFVNNPAVEFPADSTLAGTLWLAPSEKIHFGFAVSEASGTGSGFGKNTFLIAEAGINLKPAGLEGNYRLYAWRNGTDHAAISDPSVLAGANSGFGLSVDQEAGHDLSLFGRYGSQRSEVACIRRALSGGVQLSGKAYGRADDALGLAYGYAILGRERKTAAALSGLEPANEHHWELYYKWKTSDGLELSPDIQLVRNPNGDGAAGAFWAFGVRANLIF